MVAGALTCLNLCMLFGYRIFFALPTAIGRFFHICWSKMMKNVKFLSNQVDKITLRDIQKLGGKS